MKREKLNEKRERRREKHLYTTGDEFTDISPPCILTNKHIDRADVRDPTLKTQL